MGLNMGCVRDLVDICSGTGFFGGTGVVLDPNYVEKGHL